MALDIGTDGCGRGIRIHGRFERALPSEGIVSHSRIRPLCTALATNRHSFRKVFKLNDNKKWEKINPKRFFYDGWMGTVATSAVWRATRKTFFTDWVEAIVRPGIEQNVANLSVNCWPWPVLSAGYSINSSNTFGRPTTDILTSLDYCLIKITFDGK